MLPEEPPLREPLENPPPDPPRALAKDKVGRPTRTHTRHAAMSFVVFKLDSFLLTFETIGYFCHPISNERRKPNNRPVRRSSRQPACFLETSLTAWCPDCRIVTRCGCSKGVAVKQGYRLIVVDKDGVLVSEFQLTEQALAAPDAFVAALRESVESIEEAES